MNSGEQCTGITMVGQLLILLCLSVVGSAITIDDCPSTAPRNGNLRVHGNTCYEFNLDERKSFRSAQDHCEDNGGNLAMVKSESVNNYLKSTLENDYHVDSSPVWIGLFSEDDYFNWVDGSSLEYNELVEDDNPRDRCAAIVPNKKLWTTFVCHDWVLRVPMNSFICEYQIVKVAPTPKLTIHDCPMEGDDDNGIAVLDDKCYYFGLERTLTFNGAEKFCEDNGGTLALATSKTINDHLQNHLNMTDHLNEFLWIGLRYSPFDYEYRWADGSPLSYNNFKNDKGLGDCVAMNSTDGAWHHRYCNDNFVYGKYFICEFDKVSSQATPTPMSKHRTSTLSPALPTSSLSTKEFCPMMSGIGNDTHILGDKCYYFAGDKYLTFDMAKEFCGEHGGTLALVKTKRINNFIRNHLHNEYHNGVFENRFWIGLEKNQTMDQYFWLDGAPVDFSDFQYSQEVGDCAAMGSSDGRWRGTIECSQNTFLGGDRIHFICEHSTTNL